MMTMKCHFPDQKQRMNTSQLYKRQDLYIYIHEVVWDTRIYIYTRVIVMKADQNCETEGKNSECEFF